MKATSAVAAALRSAERRGARVTALAVLTAGGQTRSMSARDREVSRRVLVVEDDPLIASFMVKGLIKQGFDTQQAASAADAHVALSEGGVGVVLLDLGLPDLDGLELLRQIRATGSRVAVVTVTARSDPADHAEAARLGVDGRLLKPFALADLIEVVRTSLARATQAP